jgi:hypothetical protein
MAIKFFRSIDITGNEIQNVKLHNIGSITAGASNLGQVYFDTSTGDKKVKVNSDYASEGTFVMEPLAFETWVTANFNNYVHPNHSGQVTSAGDGATVLSTTAITAQADLGGAPASGDSMIIYDTSATALKEMTVSNLESYMQSNLNFYNINVMGDDDGTAITLNDGGTLRVSGGTAIATADSAIAGGVQITVNHSNVTNTATGGGTLTPAYGADFDAVTSVTVNAQGHVTDVTTKSITIPASDNTDTTPVVNNTTNANQPIVFVTDAGSDPDLRVDGTGTNDLTYNPSTQTLTVANLTVAGTTTTLNTETLTVDDNIIVLNDNASGSATVDAGIEIERGDDTNVSLFWDESEDAWTITNASGTYQILQSIGGTSFKVDLDAAGEASVSKTSNTYTVTHNLGTKDVIIQVVDISDATPTYETVFTENQRPTVNTVTVAFASSVADDDYRVLISQV